MSRKALFFLAVWLIIFAVVSAVCVIDLLGPRPPEQTKQVYGIFSVFFVWILAFIISLIVGMWTIVFSCLTNWLAVEIKPFFYSIKFRPIVRFYRNRNLYILAFNERDDNFILLNKAADEKLTKDAANVIHSVNLPNLFPVFVSRRIMFHDTRTVPAAEIYCIDFVNEGGASNKTEGDTADADDTSGTAKPSIAT